MIAHAERPPEAVHSDVCLVIQLSGCHEARHPTSGISNPGYIQSQYVPQALVPTTASSNLLSRSQKLMSVRIPIGANATDVFDARVRRMYSRTCVPECFECRPLRFASFSLDSSPRLNSPSCYRASSRCAFTFVRLCSPPLRTAYRGTSSV